MVFAVQPVPRTKKNAEVKTATELVQTKDNKDKDDRKDDNKDKDRIVDDNKDGVHDQREDDIQKIKNTKSKHKDIIKNKKSTAPSSGKSSSKKPSVPKKVKKK
jgi:hypothetical protein